MPSEEGRTCSSCVVDVGVQKSTCGYCKNTGNTSISHGMIARYMSVKDYQDLIDLGWRRSGTYLYKPNLATTCCPPYTIRQLTREFTPSKEHRKLIKKWDAFLSGGHELGAHTGTDCVMQDTGQSAQAHAAPSSMEGVAPPQQQRQGEKQKQKQSPGKHHPQQQQQQQQLHQGSGQADGAPLAVVVGALRELLAAAVELEVAAGRLPQVAYPPPHVKVLPPKQAKQLAGKSGGAPPGCASRGRAGAGAKTAAAASTAAVATSPRSACADGGVTLSSPVALSVAAVAAAATGSASPGGGRTKRKAGDEGGDAGGVEMGAQGHAQRRCPPLGSALGVAERLRVAAATLLAEAGVGLQREGTVAGAPGAHQGGHASQTQAQTPASVPPGPQTSLSNGVLTASGAPVVPPVCTPSPPHLLARTRAAVAPCAPLLAGCAIQAAHGHLNFHLPNLQPPQPPQPRTVEPAHRPPAQQDQQEGTHSSKQDRTAGQKQAEAQATKRVAKQAAAGGGGSTAGHAGTAAGTGRAAHKLEIITLRSQYIQEEFELYKRYQVEQHGDDPDDVTPESYTRFLVESPLVHVRPRCAPARSDGGPSAHAHASMHTGPRPANRRGRQGRESDSEEGSSDEEMSDSEDEGVSSGEEAEEGMAVPDCGYGSFHQQYRVDGVLVAVGVVDILPRGLSSVYLFWDKAFAHLAPGRFTALKELEWVQQANVTCPDLSSYYMGFYIHTCHKMRYKAQYRPSDLLCPVTKRWVRLTPAVCAALDGGGASPYIRLAALPGAAVAPNHAPVGPAGEVEGDEGDAVAAAGAASGSGSGGAGAEQRLAAARGAGAAGAGAGDGVAAMVGDVAVVLRGTCAPWGLLEAAGVLPARLCRQVRQSIKEWVQVVGGVAPCLAYELH